MNTGAFLAKSAVRHPARPALIRGVETVATYAELADRCARLARGLVERFGLRPGDRCGIAMTNAPEFVVALFGCWYANVCAVPMNAKLHRRELAYILADSGARACFVNEALTETLAGLDREVASLDHLVRTDGEAPAWRALLAGEPLPLADCDPDDPAWLFYTSGTTGRPKGATLTHRNLVAQTMNYFCDVDTLSERDCIIHSAPMSHASGCYAPPPRGPRRGAGGPGERWLRPARDHRSPRSPRGSKLLLRPHDDRAPARIPPPRRRQSRPPEDHHLRRRADVRGGYAAGARRPRAEARTDLRTGRGADDHHRTCARAPPRHRPPPLSRTARLGRYRPDGRGGPHRRPGRRAAAGRPDGRGRAARRRGDERLLGQPGGDARGAPGRMAPYRRPRGDGRGRLRHPEGSVQGPDHLWRYQPTSIRARSRRCC